MFLIVGLGNPGKEYENTRHNFGFKVLDMLADDAAWENKYDSQLIKTENLILAKPQTYMNLSGKAVAQILKYYPDAQLIVVHDKLDFPLGAIKIIKNASAAGHNGIKSLIEELGTQDFIRIRLGVNSPERGPIPAEDFVLQKFAPHEQDLVNEITEKTKAAIEVIQTQGLEIAQSKFNG